jgi:hypothetical protein
MQPLSKFLIATIGYFFAAGSIPHARADALDNLLDDLISHNELSERYTTVFGAYPVPHTRPLCVNRKANANEDCIRLIIVGHSTVTKLDRPDGALAFRRLTLNAKIVGPDTIIVDDLYLDTVVLNAINHKILLFSMYQDHSIETIYALGSLQLIANFRRSLSNDPDLLKTGWKSISEKAGDFLPLQEDKDPKSLAFISTVASLIVEHEIAHLERSATWYERIKLNAASILNSSVLLTEERRADSVALERSFEAITRYLGAITPDAEIESLYDKLRQAGSDPSAVWQMLASTHMLSVAHMFADLAIFSAVYDSAPGRFRSFNLEEVLFSMNFIPCSKERQNGDTQIGTPSEIKAAFYRALPLLTQAEFKAMSMRIGGSSQYRSLFSGATHDHGVVRAENIYSFVKSPERDRIGLFREFDLEEQVKFVRALLNGRPDDLHAGYRGGLKDVIKNADLPRLMKTLSRFGHVEPAVTCPKGSCFVTIVDGIGYVELITDSGAVAEVRMMADWGRMDKARYERSLELLGEILISLGVEKSHLLTALLNIRKPLLACRYGTSYVISGGAKMYATSFNDTGGAFLWILSSEAKFD